MAIDPETLVVPQGALTTELLLALGASFTPAQTALEAAYGYADAAWAKVSAWVDEDRALRAGVAWATYRAMMDRAQQILTAASALADEGTSRSYSASQADLLMKEAAKYLAEYEALAADAHPTAPEVTVPLASRTVPIAFAW